MLFPAADIISTRVTHSLPPSWTRSVFLFPALQNTLPLIAWPIAQPFSSEFQMSSSWILKRLLTSEKRLKNDSILTSSCASARSLFLGLATSWASSGCHLRNRSFPCLSNLIAFSSSLAGKRYYTISRTCLRLGSVPS